MGNQIRGKGGGEVGFISLFVGMYFDVGFLCIISFISRVAAMRAMCVFVGGKLACKK